MCHGDVPHLNAVENAMMRRKLRQLDTVGGAELVERLRQMAFHCPFADREAGGDFPVRAPLCDSTDDVELAFGQAERLVAPARRRQSMKARGRICDAFLTEPLSARHDGANAFEQHL